MSEKDQRDYDREDLSRDLEERFRKYREMSGKTEDKSEDETEKEKSKTIPRTPKNENSATDKQTTRTSAEPDQSSNNKQQKKSSFTMPDFSNVKFNFGKGSKAIKTLGLGVVLLGFLATGFYTVNESERGVVKRFGAYYATKMPGLNWRVPVIDKVTKVNVQQVGQLRIEGTMLTQDENVVNVTLTVQYRVDDPYNYLYMVDAPETTLREATEASLRFVVGHMKMDDVITTGRSIVRENTRQMLLKTLESYNVGIGIVDVNFQSARPPEEVKESFDDAIKAQEDEQRYIREAEAYQRSREPIARGQARQIIAQAQGYAASIIAKANADAAEYNNLLPQFLANPSVFKQRYYLEAMAELYGNTPKVIMQDNNAITFLPLDKLLSTGKAPTQVKQGDGSLLQDPNQAQPTTPTPSYAPTTTTPTTTTPAATDNRSPVTRDGSRTAPSRFNTRGSN
ncbi:FtsH protease activity modulator HflK [Psittacicella hinzii]|uniref:Protein HflK n=1 Tax=Psittacicella hinzii TaxID=2028575 RepID=A0A3A1YP11_9GAMM|nr:FtsH protease activity modulator HflK [Psittacicella hinzii]RIY40013.1 FtsH protease activity modulator HflK [Psittacicella hinzii]